MSSWQPMLRGVWGKRCEQGREPEVRGTRQGTRQTLGRLQASRGAGVLLCALPSCASQQALRHGHAAEHSEVQVSSPFVTLLILWDVPSWDRASQLLQHQASMLMTEAMAATSRAVGTGLVVEDTLRYVSVCNSQPPRPRAPLCQQTIWSVFATQGDGTVRQPFGSPAAWAASGGSDAQGRQTVSFVQALQLPPPHTPARSLLHSAAHAHLCADPLAGVQRR